MALVLVGSVGCARAAITRQYAVDRTAAAAYGSRARVVAIERHGNRLAVNDGVIDTDAHTITTGRDRLYIGDEDRLTIVVTFRRGERVPEEGVVTTRPSVPLLVGGTAAILTGAVVTIAGVCGAADQCQDSPARGGNAIPITDVDKSETAFFFLLAGGALALGGIVTTIIGAIPKLGIAKTSGIAITPVMLKTGAGTALQVTF